MQIADMYVKIYKTRNMPPGEFFSQILDISDNQMTIHQQKWLVSMYRCVFLISGSLIYSCK